MAHSNKDQHTKEASYQQQQQQPKKKKKKRPNKEAKHCMKMKHYQIALHKPTTPRELEREAKMSFYSKFLFV